jgi:large subunit ribosomal protein L3
MLNTLLGTKREMSQAFVEGTRVPVSLIKVGPCIVTQVKKKEKDGYWAVQIGFGEKKIKNITKPLQGHLKGATKDKKAPRFLREVKFEEEPKLKQGNVISVSDVFKKGDLVAVTGISKGKGFQGVVKRWGFAGGPRTHGQSDRLRAPGSIGQGTTPGRVWKGKKMPGRMGGEKITIQNLVVVKVEPDKNEIALSGPVPGNPKGLLIIKKLASGKLDELVQEAPEVQAQVEQPEEGEPQLDSAKHTQRGPVRSESISPEEKDLKSESKEKGGKK